MEFIKSVLLNRLKEQSTWIGIIALAANLGLHITPEQTTAIATFGGALVGAILVFWPEKKVVVTEQTKTDGK